MAIGMSYEDFWYMDPNMVKYYREAEMVRLHRQNSQMYMQGMYIYDTLMRSAPIFNPFNKNVDPRPYRDEPFPLTEQEAEEQLRKEEEREYRSMRDRMIGGFEKINRNMEAMKGSESDDY